MPEFVVDTVVSFKFGDVVGVFLQPHGSTKVDGWEWFFYPVIVPEFGVNVGGGLERGLGLNTGR